MAKKTGNHEKKVRRMPGSRLVTLFAGIAVVYFVAQLIGALTTSYNTVSATYVTVNDSVTATGYFIRDEVVVSGTSGGMVEHAVHNGERISEGARLAVEYADESALAASREIKEIENQIALLSSAMQASGDLADTAKIDQLIAREMQAIAQKASGGMISDVADASVSMRQLLLRRAASSQDISVLGEEIAALQARQASLTQLVSNRASVTQAPCSGYFSEVVDGYESVLTPADIGSLTVFALNAKTQQAGNAPDSAAFGKVIRGFEWYFAVAVPPDQMDGLEKGQTYSLRFSQAAGDVPAKLHEVRADAESGETLLIFQSSVIHSEFLTMRRQVVEIIKETYSGIKIPKQAVYMQDGKLGVYILSGAVSRFKTIETLYEGDTFFVIKQGYTQDTTVVVQDEVIVTGRGLQDRKVLK